ncbi:MAG TPA: PDZ domain-containing protein, partial [Gemmatimonadales bacterium]
GRYRITRIYGGESWNPSLKPPLAAPGVNVAAGDYVLEVNGVPVQAGENVHRFFEGTSGKQTVLRVNSRPTAEGARTVTVVPVGPDDDFGLRTAAWVEGNRRYVDSASGGKLAYVWLPNTSFEGYAYFNRYYFAQMNRAGAVIDERFNGGGSIADYFIDIMTRRLKGFFNNPVGDRRPWTAPEAGIWGPKVMLINESAGSGGDMLPYMFKLEKIGPLIGTRTWGGLVGIWDVPPLVDGGLMTAPRGGFFNLAGEWEVENEGITPDIEVEQTPKETVGGRDPQLERAVQEAMRLLGQWKSPLKAEPAAPVRVRRP